MSIPPETHAAPTTGRAGSWSELRFLDGMRGLAALYVMLGHARWLLWEGYSEGYLKHRDAYGPAGKALVFAAAGFRFGHEAVLFFFVLSGFVIHLKYARRLAVDGAAARFDPGNYAFRRARRLYPPLVTAMLITWALDALGSRLQLPTATGTTIYANINANVGADHSALTALRNLAFIMDPVFGSDGPLWSLGYEGYFYAIYPLVFLASRRSLRGATAVLVVLTVIGFLPGWPPGFFWLRGICRLMIVWWLGALLASRFVQALAPARGPALGAGDAPVPYRRLRWLAVTLLVVPIWRWDPFVRDIIIGFGFVGLLSAGLAHVENGRSTWWLAGLTRLRPLGAMAYTLYAVHFPILVFMGGCLMKRSGGPLPAHFGWVGAGAALTVTIAYGLHFLIERPFTSR